MKLVTAALLRLLVWPASRSTSQNLKGYDGTPNDDVITPAAQMHVESGRTNHKPGDEPDPSYQSKARDVSLASFDASLTKQW